MANLVHLVYEYRRLLAHQELMGRELSGASEARLASLERLFGQEPTEAAETVGLAYKRRHARCEVRVPATIKMSGDVLAVDVTSLGGGGVRIEPAPSLRRGERAVIRIVSLDTGSIYHYPVTAGWCERSRKHSAMGLGFVGAPRQLSLSS